MVGGRSRYVSKLVRPAWHWLLSAVFHNYGDVFSWSRNTTQFLGFELGQERRQVSPGERPLKRLCGLLVPSLECEQPILQFVQRREVVWRNHFALNN